jgi:hypothetical protein
MALDKEAMERGNSVYFPRRVIPMLPEKLSNGLCSLNPDVERLAMVCDMEINNSGVIKAYSFYPAVFQSKARLTYNQGLGLAVRQDATRKRRAPRLAAAVAGAQCAVPDPAHGAPQARCDRLRDDRDDDAVQRSGQDRQHRSGLSQ